ncbi:Teichuronic acid biosynthesis protein TuaB [Ensifer sp. M14]|uniref:Succinoglycan biosynthesis transport protein, ExoT n=2 Tax=Sinorhizobium sp. M14 TaxID=430451 RepID=A0A142BPL9_9HYPH|nr:oligosaccharide flippase family protein [Ensifer sp. M14]AMP35027.1 Succinoglycan biosynthesis transport protein, ExoT [Sinorhizobium sp. M14]RDL48006.1 Teichuronic acid biosynthesis protein TuaB [Ensifer sp. M14]
MVVETDGMSSGVETKRRFRLSTPTIVGGGLWALSAKLVSQVAQLSAFIAAARILTPQEFGFFAFSSAVATFLVVFAEGGWAEFVMKSADGEGHLDQVTTISLVSGLLFTALGLGAAGILYEAFDKILEASLLALFSCLILPCAMTTVYDGALVHRGQLQSQAIIRITAEAAGLALIVFGLFMGWNVFALIAGRLAMQLVLLCGSIMAVGWVRPVGPTRMLTRELLGFSQHVVANRLIVFLRSYSGTLAVGGFLGLAEAGYYRAAERIVAALYELVGEPARMLAWIVLRRARDRENSEVGKDDAVRKAGNMLFPLLLAVATPVLLGLALVADDFVDLVLGEVWAPAATVVSILSIKQLLMVSGCMTEPLLSIQGNIRRMAPVGLANSLVIIGLVVALAPFGLLPLAYGQVLAGIVVLATLIWLQGRYGGLDWYGIARGSGFVPLAVAGMTCTMFALGLAIDLSTLQTWATLVLQAAAGATGYLLVLLLVRRFATGMFPVLVVVAPLTPTHDIAGR